MVLLKHVADLLTASRAVISVLLAWFGFTMGQEALSLASILMLASWTTDILDGSLARRSGFSDHNWISEHDLLFDIAVSVGLLVYMMFAEIIPFWVGGVYSLIWLILFWKIGILASLGKLFQAPIYGWFILTAIQKAPMAGWTMVICLALIIVITWPRFPQQVIPSFLGGWKELHKKIVIR